MLEYEKEFWSKGFDLIAGIDEAGRGPLAGPVVAAAVILMPESLIAGVKDSKKLSPGKREMFYWQIQEKAVAVGVGIVDEGDIDNYNILAATYIAMKKAIDDLAVKPQYILVDGREIPRLQIPQSAIIAGDTKSILIAAASIIAKVTRDRIMIELDTQFPQYGFARHKGYATRDHLKALKEYGACRSHRRSFAPVREILRADFGL